MATFKELLHLAQVSLDDKTSGKRMREIEHILHAHHAFSGLTPEKATAILEDLGPTFVKMGQIASNRSDVIPKEYADAFKQLHANVSPVSFQTIVETIERSLGKPWDQVFSSLDQEPLGSASVAQVHKATLAVQPPVEPLREDAREPQGSQAAQPQAVAVKVRRPNVNEQMAQDITLLRHVLALADLSPAPTNMVLTVSELVDELARTTAEELDFGIELSNLQRFSQGLASVQGITSPRPFPQVSTDEVLVMEYVEGQHIDQVEQLRAQGDNPAELGQRLAENYVSQVIDQGFFHADPHPGNILVRNHELVWIDLGMTGTLSASERAIVSNMFMAVAMNDSFALKDSLLTLAKPRGPVDHGLLLEQIDNLMASYASASLKDINAGTALLDVIEVLRTQNLTLPSSMTMLARGLMTIEGVLVDVSPATNVVSIITAHVKRQLLNVDSLKAKAKSAFMDSAASAQAFSRLPSQVSHTLDMVNRGQVRMTTDMQVPKNLIAVIYSVTGTLALALISAGLVVGSGLIAQTDMAPKVLGIPLLGVLGFLGAFALSVYVIYRVFKARHQQRNNLDVD